VDRIVPDVPTACTELETRREPGLVERRAADRAAGEKPLGHRHAAEVHAFERFRRRALAEDQFRAAAADVHDQPQAVVRGQAVGHALVDQARLFPSGDDLDRMAERRLGLGHEPGVLAGAPDRARSRRPDAGRVHLPESFAETREAVDRADACVGGEVAALRQAFGEAYGLANAVDDDELAMPQLADDHVKAVGTEIDGRDDLGRDVRPRRTVHSRRWSSRSDCE
jgi:hypothetical protein